MPLTLSVGVSKKQGLPDYGSLGASCNLAVEMDAALLHDLDSFHRQVRNAYVACTQAVNDELARHQGGSLSTPQTTASSNGYARNGQEHTNGHAGNGNGNGHIHSNNGQTSHRASPKQLDYAGQLAKQIRGLGIRKLEGLATKMFGKPLADLSTLDASGLIDTLKAIKEERISLEEALSGVTL